MITTPKDLNAVGDFSEPLELDYEQVARTMWTDTPTLTDAANANAAYAQAMDAARYEMFKACAVALCYACSKGVAVIWDEGDCHHIIDGRRTSWCDAGTLRKLYPELSARLNAEVVK